MRLFFSACFYAVEIASPQLPAISSRIIHMVAIQTGTFLEPEQEGGSGL